MSTPPSCTASTFGRVRRMQVTAMNSAVRRAGISWTCCTCAINRRFSTRPRRRPRPSGSRHGRYGVSLTVKFWCWSAPLRQPLNRRRMVSATRRLCRRTINGETLKPRVCDVARGRNQRAVSIRESRGVRLSQDRSGRSARDSWVLRDVVRDRQASNFEQNWLRLPVVEFRISRGGHNDKFPSTRLERQF
jgi:hypothetical protein